MFHFFHHLSTDQAQLQVTPFVSILRSVQMRKQQQLLLRASGGQGATAPDLLCSLCIYLPCWFRYLAFVFLSPENSWDAQMCQECQEMLKRSHQSDTQGASWSASNKTLDQKQRDLVYSLKEEDGRSNVLFMAAFKNLDQHTCEERCDALYGPARGGCRVGSGGSGCGQSGHCSGGSSRVKFCENWNYENLCIFGIFHLNLSRFLSRGGACSTGRRGRGRCGGVHDAGCAERRDPGEAGESGGEIRKDEEKESRSSCQLRKEMQGLWLIHVGMPQCAMRSSTPPLSPTAFFKAKHDPTGAAELVQPCSKFSKPIDQWMHGYTDKRTYYKRDISWHVLADEFMTLERSLCCRGHRRPHRD